MSKTSKFMVTLEEGEIILEVKVMVSKELDEDFRKRFQKCLELDTVFFLTECIRPVLDGKVDLSKISVEG